MDSAVSGQLLRVKLTPSLAGLLKGALGDIEDPATGGTLLEAWSGEVQMLGSGSDYAGERLAGLLFVGAVPSWVDQGHEQVDFGLVE